FGFTVSGINNAAHIGGMIMGVLLASAWYFSQKRPSKRIIQILALVIATILLFCFYFYCTKLSAGLNPLWHEILRQNQFGF
ncbi:MAG: rhomboid family intramembrane serine protease, partial [Acinetobacter sp.]